MEIFDKVKQAAASNSEQVEARVDQAGDFVDQKTDDKHKGQVDQAQDFAKDKLRGQE